MPCYIVQLTSVEFRAKYREQLEEALRRLRLQFAKSEWGYRIQNMEMEINLETEQITVPEGAYYQAVVNKLKQTYSAVCLEEIAKKKRWALKQSKTSANKFQFVRL